MISALPIPCIRALLCLVGCAAISVCAAEPPRAARSVHLGYPATEGELFYNEVTVEQSTAGSYFMACGWNTGYFGMQELRSPTNKVVIFSVWDPTKGDEANKVPLEQRVEVLHEGDGVKVSRFGGEGTGGKSMWPYLWETNEVCRFAVSATVAGDKTSYAGWFYDNRARTNPCVVTTASSKISGATDGARTRCAGRVLETAGFAPRRANGFHSAARTSRRRERNGKRRKILMPAFRKGTSISPLAGTQLARASLEN